MKVSLNWLRDYVNFKQKPDELAHMLTMAGLEVIRVEHKGPDTIFEIEVTTNRPDWLSIVGVAREIAAITGCKLRLPKTRNKKPQTPDPRTQNRISVSVESAQDCPRYTARIIQDVKVGPSPKWLAEKLEALGIRPVNNVVDITNFCLLELGQPLHAFDLDRLKGKNITIRRARDKEEITTIDGQKRTLDKEALVIADTGCAVALAGVMGGLDSEVKDTTKNILLESAYFMPELIRASSKKLGISTESSFRFERTVDFDTVEFASLRASALIEELAGGKACEFADAAVKPRPKANVMLDIQWMNNRLGTDIKEAGIKKYLECLGFGIKKAGSARFEIIAPSFRRDINEPVDIMEEVARVYGYDNIKGRLPDFNCSKRPFEGKLTSFDIISGILVSAGLNEVITYSMTEASLLASYTAGEIISIKNPLSSQQQYLRPTLIPTIIKTAKDNLNSGNSNLRLFEIANVYMKGSAGHKEAPALAILLCCDRFNNWQDKSRKADFFDLKGIIEFLLAKLGIADYEFLNESHSLLSKEQCASVKAGKETIGICGKASDELINTFDIKDDVFVAELFLDRILDKINFAKTYKEIPKFPRVARDVSVIADKGLKLGDIFNYARQAAGVLFDGITLFDEYTGAQIPAGKRGLSFSIYYQAKDKTLTDSQINDTHSKVCDGLCREFGLQIR